MEITALLFKIALSTIALYFMLRDLYRIVKKEAYYTVFKFVLNNLVWGTILIFTLNPSLAKSVSRALGLGENLNTLIFVGFVIVFIMIFRLIQISEHHERTITDLVRKQALSKLTEKKNHP